MEQDLKWPSHLVILRHAESERNVARAAAMETEALEYGGMIRDVDVRLTARGRDQALATGQGLAQLPFHFDRIFASPYERTLTTAHLVREQLKYSVDVTWEERIREIEFGILDGVTKAGIQHKYPDEWARKQRLGKYWYRAPGGESYPDVALRLHSFLGTLTRDFRGKSVLVVCHSVVVLLFRRLLERMTEQQLLEIDSDPQQEVWNCSATHYACQSVDGKSPKLQLQSYNTVYYDRAAGNPA